jgi:hypothetical protein
MKHHFSPFHGVHALSTASSAGEPAALIEQLEALLPGTRVMTRDGARFIRTNRTCFCFCDLATGHLCSAKDLCYLHGGALHDGAGRMH